MIIIIDAYNLLRAVPPYKKTITDQERVQFIAQLSLYGRRKGHKIVIVFDGGPHEWPFKESINKVTVVYSGIHDSADDYIKSYVDAHRAKDLLLVSSDRELNQWAERYTIPSIDSVSFHQLVVQELKIKTNKHEQFTSIVKMQDEQLDIDRLMMEGSAIVPMKSEDINLQRKNRGTKKAQVSKHERVLLKKLNKL
ncbi:MAG TPA: NYN domain-containing protein [Candidatus Babeliales bacterium]|nr:NYN domain-containing protein [Candidatus Babeliales bacterium]